MATKFHGVLSLILIKISVLVALAALFLTAPLAGMVYLITVMGASVIILYAYCAKCICRLDACSHVFPGKATRWFPRRRQEPYTAQDLLATALSLAIIFLFPQYWLWHHKPLFLIFWALTIIALVDIRLYVCKLCGNKTCILCPSRL